MIEYFKPYLPSDLKKVRPQIMEDNRKFATIWSALQIDLPGYDFAIRFKTLNSFNKMNLKMKRFLCMVLAALCLLTALPVACLAAAREQMITVPFFAADMWKVKWDFPYADSYFLEPSGEFSRDLAKASMGLTVSAFRKSPPSDVPNQYETYLTEAGFADIHPFGYDKPTAVDTLSGVIASKQIGDFTLIAAAPCGQGYENEWGGNLNLGTEERHAGFNEGAMILENEILLYIEEHNLTGKLKLWISSFSRGSAVSNLAAADLIESGRFEDVYAYLFGVPRTTKNPQMYPGIYNICGAYDPVPQVPLQSWGYYRHGKDLYLPAAATDANYAKKTVSVSKVAEAVSGDAFRNNPELNYQLHLILEFLGELLPESRDYCEVMQEKVMKLWTVIDPDQMVDTVLEIFLSLDDLDSRQEHSRNTFVDYLIYLIDKMGREKRSSFAQKDTGWAQKQSIGANVMREHSPYIYLSWIFSDLTDEDLFNASNATHRLSVVGDVDVEVWQDGEFLNGIDRYGEWIAKPKDLKHTAEIGKSIFVRRSGSMTTVLVPENESVQVRITTHEPTSFTYHAQTGSVAETYGTLGAFHLIVATPGLYELDFFRDRDEPGDLVTTEGSIVNDIPIDAPYSPTMDMEMQVETDDHLSVKMIVRAIVAILLSVVLLLLICLVIAIVHAVRKKKHGPYSPWYVIVPHYLLLLMFVWLTILMTRNMYLVTYARVCAAAASGLVLTLLSLRGLIRNRNLVNLLITIGMLLLTGVNAFIYQRSGIAGRNLAVNLIYCGIMAILAVIAAYALLSAHRLEKKNFGYSDPHRYGGKRFL